VLLNFAASSPKMTQPRQQKIPFGTARMSVTADRETRHIGGYARASYASGGGGAPRVPRIAGDVTAGPALVT
jgi:hypothetical protein